MKALQRRRLLTLSSSFIVDLGTFIEVLGGTVVIFI